MYQARHDRIDQFGGTLAKDLGSAVLKAEAIYTRGRSYGVTRLDDDDGVVRQNTLDVVGGLDFTLRDDTRFNVQLFNRTFFDHDPDIIYTESQDGNLSRFHRPTGDRKPIKPSPPPGEPAYRFNWTSPLVIS